MSENRRLALTTGVILLVSYNVVRKLYETDTYQVSGSKQIQRDLHDSFRVASTLEPTLTETTTRKTTTETTTTGTTTTGTTTTATTTTKGTTTTSTTTPTTAR